MIRVRVILRVKDWGFVIGGLGLGVPRLGLFPLGTITLTLTLTGRSEPTGVEWFPVVVLGEKSFPGEGMLPE